MKRRERNARCPCRMKNMRDKRGGVDRKRRKRNKE